MTLRAHDMTETAQPPHRLNAWLAGAAFAIAGVQLVAAPLLLLPHSPWIAAALVAALSLTTPFTSALMHEAIHGRLAPSPRGNDRLGRALAACWGVAFDAMRFGHMSHHRFNRHALDRPDVIEPGASGLRARIDYYFGLLGGIYLREIGASLAMLLPRRVLEVLIARALASEEPEIAAMRGAMRRGLDRRLWRMRLDVTLAVALYVTAFALYGAYWPLLVLALALRGLIVSLMDNAPHYRTPATVGADAHNSRAGRLIARFLLNQNLHAVHHDRPELPWTALPRAFERSSGHYAGGYLALMLAQLRGPWRPPETASRQPSAERLVAAE